MKRSVHVSAPLLAATALALTAGCRKPQMQRCVDEQNHVVADSFCQNPSHPPFHVTGAQCFDAQNHPVAMNFCNTPQNVHPTGTGFYYPMYRYYYGGSGSYGIGSFATGGGYAPTSGASYASSSSSTSRGGFGSSFGGSSGSSGHGSSGGGGE